MVNLFSGERAHEKAGSAVCGRCIWLKTQSESANHPCPDEDVFAPLSPHVLLHPCQLMFNTRYWAFDVDYRDS